MCAGVSSRSHGRCPFNDAFAVVNQVTVLVAEPNTSSACLMTLNIGRDSIGAGCGVTCVASCAVMVCPFVRVEMANWDDRLKESMQGRRRSRSQAARQPFIDDGLA